MNKCYCFRGFFQCRSGGCIPVGTLCDRVYNCKNGSDEPVSCEFDSVQTQRSDIEHWNVLRRKCSQGIESKVFLVNHFDLNPPAEVHYKTVDDGDYVTSAYDLGIIYMICFDKDPDNPFNTVTKQIPRYFLHRWCVYDYSWFDDIGYSHFPCVQGYHLSSCENMHCTDTFKCMRSYCLEWKYVCDNTCDCPHCEDESICEQHCVFRFIAWQPSW